MDTCAGEFSSKTPYLYSTYDWDFENTKFCEANPTSKDKVIILGGGPNRIGQGIEFDYCCVHAVYALKEKGIETIMINCNPETVSTDYDTADRLYFEPLSAESVIEIYNKEKSNGNVLGVLVQFGGQTPLKIAKELEEAGIKVIGTSTEAIDLAEDRDRFSEILMKLKIAQPKNAFANTVAQTLEKAEEIGYPVLVRPSYVLGGRAMQIAYDKDNLESFSNEALEVSSNNVILIDEYLENAKEIDVDIIRDKNGEIFVAGIMEHIEEAGIHSGDSACSLPPYSVSKETQNKIIEWVSKIANEINVVGLMNTQLAIKDKKIYVLEVNPRASRTVLWLVKDEGGEPKFYPKRIIRPYRNPWDRRVAQLIKDGKRGCSLYDWWEINLTKNVNKEKSDYSNQIPQVLLQRIIRSTTDVGDLVVDPFSGTFSTAKAALATGRLGWGCDRGWGWGSTCRRSWKKPTRSPRSTRPNASGVSEAVVSSMLE